MNPLLDEPAISLLVREHDEPGIEVRVNFGVFAGRHATPAEIDELALALQRARRRRSRSWRRSGTSSATPSRRRCTRSSSRCRGRTPATSPTFLAEQIVLAANGWALECIASRHGAGEL